MADSPVAEYAPLILPIPGARTGVIASIGRAFHDVETLCAGIVAGAFNFRLPLSLADRDLTADFHAIREAGRRVGQSVRVLLDLPATRPRTGAMSPRMFSQGDEVVMLDAEAGEDHIPVPGITAFFPALRSGCRLLFRDGRQVFELLDVLDGRLYARCVVCEEPLQACTGVCFPDSVALFDSVRPRDLALFAQFAAEGLKPDGVMVSFTTHPRQLDDVRAIFPKTWGEDYGIRVMAKLETPSAFDALDDILTASDGALLGRGDMGVAAKPEDLPVYQHRLARAGARHGRPILVATQFLERFAFTGAIYRAELSDVALAVTQGVAGVVLCAETNDSPRPVETIGLARRLIFAATEGMGL